MKGILFLEFRYGHLKSMTSLRCQLKTIKFIDKLRNKSKSWKHQMAYFSLCEYMTYSRKKSLEFGTKKDNSMEV